MVSLTHFITLAKQMRQSKDKEYAELIKRLKNGTCTYKLLCSKIINYDRIFDESMLKFTDISVQKQYARANK